MTRLLTSALALVLAPVASWCGPLDVPPPQPPVVIAAPDAAFDGFYVGLEYGHVSGDFTGTNGQTSETFDFDDGSAWGGVAGYNRQSGRMVYGGEIRMLHFPDFEAFGGTTFIEDVTDLRGRVGYVMGDAMIYGALGYSWATFDPGLAPNVDVDGLNLGLGAEYNVTDSIFVGADFTTRDMSGDSGGSDYDVIVNTLTLRAGFRF
jgi:opacity protein-like surface antigen